MQRAAVIGDPISHSLSPIIFSVIQTQLGISDFGYEAVQVSREDLHSFITQTAKESKYVGLNVTLPHKQAILSILDKIG